MPFILLAACQSSDSYALFLTLYRERADLAFFYRPFGTAIFVARRLHAFGHASSSLRACGPNCSLKIPQFLPVHGIVATHPLVLLSLALYLQEMPLGSRSSCLKGASLKLTRAMARPGPVFPSVGCPAKAGLPKSRDRMPLDFRNKLSKTTICSVRSG
jgi:hypothetical protein